MSVMEQYLRATSIIDWNNQAVLMLARSLAEGQDSPAAVARQCFEWVRDQVQHSIDYNRDEVTCAASEVLAQRTGFCYAKSHLLVALCRANDIPAGLCYQRLLMDKGVYCLHGLAAVYLPAYGWYRIDPRGNKPGVDAQFVPPREQLAFPIEQPGEADLPQIHADPLPLVVNALQAAHDAHVLACNLPDLPTVAIEMEQV